MEQRRLRLGDILDDYCPRERRVTNHAVVAMIEEEVRQTRCTTCDAEHPYKGARVPKRRKKEPSIPAVVHTSIIEEQQLPMHNDEFDVAPPVDTETVLRADRHEATEPRTEPTPLSASPEAALSDSEHEAAPADAVVDGPVHRPLIRATLPRPEGQKDARPVPEFTVRHSPSRGNGHAQGNGGFRGERMRMRGNGNNYGAPGGNRGQGQSRFSGGSGNRSQSGRPSSGRGASGFRNGNGGPNGKRGRGSRG
jgi:hypothetical protein